ncbi:MAG TPA: hypothetical protein VGA63_04910 [Geopsychrobacteraceae bacterium]|jgi:hypothetical protein
MDKSRLLREFAARAAEESFDIGVVRLYLLLLAGGRPSGHGSLTIEEAKTAFGEEFSSVALHSACDVLVAKGLIEICSGRRAAGAGEDLDLRYRLLPVRKG